MDDDRLHELFACLAPIRITRMFGGKGIYADGMILAVVVGGELMMKADGECAGAFEEAGAARWRYDRKGRAPVEMPYWTLPDEAYDDPAVMAHFASLSLSAARRAAEAKSRPTSRRRQRRMPHSKA